MKSLKPHYRQPFTLIGLLFLFMLAIEGCRVDNTPMPTAAPPASATVVSTQTTVPMITVTETPSPTVTAQALPTQCLEVKQISDLSDVIQTGTIRTYTDDGQDTIFWNLKTGELKSVESLLPQGISIEGLEVSPNRQLIAIGNRRWDNTLWKIWVVTLSGEIQDEIPIATGWMDFSWINNELIGFQPEAADWDGTMRFYNLASGEQYKTPFLFNDLYHKTEKTRWKLSYSPDMKWLAYLDNNEDFKIVDLETKKVIWQDEGDYRGMEPSWSPSGDRITFIDWEGKQLIIRRDGKIEEFPYPAALEKPKDPYTLFWDGFAWSPDGRYLAVWANTKLSGRLLILDTQRNQLIDYCLDMDNHREVLWSPDGLQLVATVRYKSSSYSTLYLNLAREEAYIIDPIMTIFDWLK